MSRRRRYTQRELIRKLEEQGWTRTVGGRHQTKMVKPGERSITIPEFRRAVLPIGLSNAILKQAEIEEDNL